MASARVSVSHPREEPLVVIALPVVWEPLYWYETAESLYILARIFWTGSVPEVECKETESIVIVIPGADLMSYYHSAKSLWVLFRPLWSDHKIGGYVKCTWVT